MYCIWLKKLFNVYILSKSKKILNTIGNTQEIIKSTKIIKEKKIKDKQTKKLKTKIKKNKLKTKTRNLWVRRKKKS